MERIHEMHAHSMVSVWPNMNAGGKNSSGIFFDAGYLLYDYATYDAFNEKQEKCTGNRRRRGCLTRALIPGGVTPQSRFSGPDWGRCGENESPGSVSSWLEASTRNTWILLWPTLLPWSMQREFMRTRERDREDMRVLNLTRSGYASGQKYAAMLWSGDTCADWKNLKIQIVEGLNMGLSGYPYWTLDIGAFFHSCR